MSSDSSPSTPGGGREAARPGLARVSSSHPDSPPISTGPLPTSSTPAPEVEEGEADLGDSVSLSSDPGSDPGSRSGFCAMHRREGGRVGAVGAASLPLSEARGAPTRAPSARPGGLSGLRASGPTPVARLAPFSDPPSESVSPLPPPGRGGRQRRRREEDVRLAQEPLQRSGRRREYPGGPTPSPRSIGPSRAGDPPAALLHLPDVVPLALPHRRRRPSLVPRPTPRDLLRRPTEALPLLPEGLQRRFQGGDRRGGRLRPRLRLRLRLWGGPRRLCGSLRASRCGPPGPGAPRPRGPAPPPAPPPASSSRMTWLRLSETPRSRSSCRRRPRWRSARAPGQPPRSRSSSISAPSSASNTS